ncbi:MAG: secretin N-terminal domain-containing protein [Pyrinomonadaceae bacterium]
MKNSVNARFSLSLLLLFSLMSPVAALAVGDGKKHFKQGMKHEISEEWDQAVEEFAVAATESPKNPEYKLHLQRALFNASQMYMKKGTTAAQQKDYESAYNAFRKAYAYDPVNELAKSEMARMIRMQEALQKGDDPEGKTDANGKLKLIPTSYNIGQAPQDFQIPQRLEKMRDVPFPGGVDLQYIVKELAKDLDLNVLFDAESRLENRKIRIELKNVTAAKALDYIFLQENLFFQKVGPRTILVATGNRRTNFQQLVLRTFYLANANPKDVKTIITSAIPAQPGRSQTIVIEDATTNSLTIRDTEENVRLFAKLISSLDKDRAEVVMDVAIYEINKNDLLKLGNQIGTPAQLNNIGGSNNAVFPLTGGFGAGILTRVASGLLIPSSVITAFQSKGNTKLLASTQIHAFNNEDSSARIGQRVPVRTASFAPVGNTGGQNGNNNFVGDVINYEQVGLTLKFKPIVFPNQDVQVAMEIESKDVASGGTQDNPIFTERTIKGTARVQNNKTLLLASVAQDVESNGRAGLPVLGWIPIIGRLFATPTRDNRQVDIVIAVTPRVIRAPAILPEDEVERPTGSLATPTSGSLEAMIIQEEIEEQLASIRRLPTTARVQLPDRSVEKPAYVRTGTDTASSTPAVGADATFPAPASQTESVVAKTSGLGMNLKPIDSTVKTLQINQTSDTSNSGRPAIINPVDVPEAAASKVELTLGTDIPSMKAGEKMRIPVMIKSSGPFRSAVLGLKFDDKKMAVRSVMFGDVFGMGIANTAATPFLNQGGKMFVSLTAANQAVAVSQGILAYVEIEALADGKPEINLERDVLNFLTADGRNLPVKF